jgi:hypothetical protein
MVAVSPCPFCNAEIETPKKKRNYQAVIYHDPTCLLDGIIRACLHSEKDVTDWNTLVSFLPKKEEPNNGQVLVQTKEN